MVHVSFIDISDSVVWSCCNCDQCLISDFIDSSSIDCLYNVLYIVYFATFLELKNSLDLLVDWLGT